MYQLANVFVHLFNNADADSFGTTPLVNASLLLKQPVFQIFTAGTINSAIVFAKLNQLVFVTLNSSTQLVVVLLTQLAQLQKYLTFQLVNANAH